MVRKYKRKSTRGSYGEDSLQNALHAVRNGMNIAQASLQYGIPSRTIRRHRDRAVQRPGTLKLGPVETVLPRDIEQQLAREIQLMERRMYAITTIDVRRLAYELAERQHVRHKFDHNTRMAGKDWLRGFIQRNGALTIRKPIATSLARINGFTENAVNGFFDVLEDTLQNGNFNATNIWNCDETGMSTVVQPGKDVATKGVRQVRKASSAERGKNTTALCCMNAAGNFLPPMIIFPRKRFQDILMQGAPAGAIGGVNVKGTGYIDQTLFLRWLHHFQAVTNCSINAKHLLLLDGHESHKTLEAVEYGRTNGIVMISLPPHSSHRLQPLDRTFFKTLNTNYERQVHSFMMSHHGERVTQFHVAGLFGAAYNRSATVISAANGFRCTGIWPFDRHKFDAELQLQQAAVAATPPQPAAVPPPPAAAHAPPAAAPPPPAAAHAPPVGAPPPPAAAHAPPAAAPPPPAAAHTPPAAAPPPPAAAHAPPAAAPPPPAAAHAPPAAALPPPAAAHAPRPAAPPPRAPPVQAPRAASPPAPAPPVRAPPAAAPPQPARPVRGQRAAAPPPPPPAPPVRASQSAAPSPPAHPVRAPRAAAPPPPAHHVRGQRAAAPPPPAPPVRASRSAAQSPPAPPVQAPRAAAPPPPAHHVRGQRAAAPTPPAPPVRAPRAAAPRPPAPPVRGQHAASPRPPAPPVRAEPAAAPPPPTLVQAPPAAALPPIAAAPPEDSLTKIMSELFNVKAAERKTTPGKNSRKQQSALLTGSPFKDSLQTKRDNAARKPHTRQTAPQPGTSVRKGPKKHSEPQPGTSTGNRSKKQGGGKGSKRKRPSTKGKRKRTKRRHDSSEDSDDDIWPCLVCGEAFADSRPRERWIQCQVCLKWAHEECTAPIVRGMYICENCNSDSE